MITSTGPARELDGDSRRFVAAENDATIVASREPSSHDDAYADSELELRHERTERMIRKALEQA